MLDVSVVVRAFGGQERLDLTLASLAAQSYPVGLMEVVVVDDGSDPPIRLPEVRPPHTRIVVVPPGGWGRGHAVNSGVAASDADVVLFLDADIIAFRDHVEAQMRWHHLADYLVVTGHLRCVDHRFGTLSPVEVADAVGRGEPEALVDGPGEEMAWLRRAYDRKENLRAAGYEAFTYFIGATGSVRRELLVECGGTAPELLLGEDTHLGYRLAQRGAVFVPEPDSRSWHLGLPEMERRKAEGVRYRVPFVGNRIPRFGVRRGTGVRQWQVPCVDVVVEVSGVVFEVVSDTVERVLGGDVADVRVTLVGEWRRVSAGGRHAVLDDPDVELRLVREAFRCESRVVFAEEVPRADPDVPFRLFLPTGLPLARHAVRRMVQRADEARAGLLRAAVPGSDRGGPRLERTAAFARARRLGAGAEDVDALVGEVSEVHWIDGETQLLTEEDGPPRPPEDWRAELARAEREAAEQEARAGRLERRYRWLTGTRSGRLLRRIIE
ncbi:glycosyltransferase family A protein [Nocardiopsis sp. CT-R113]|uniref:4,4'-diaponeurosporenoate glycosyltransferase n=1 Tax=Nocardiopsis codii TaxID=3065942 RepID=A0ABU7K6C7_9ACTN|nr:glycosyltransferase family A protein [Nocardiopsis sp. CT-R113]MEE2037804.1 glycosyltransferase family A protein [Nocardiopsis sp. CT-R113]